MITVTYTFATEDEAVAFFTTRRGPNEPEKVRARRQLGELDTYVRTKPPPDFILKGASEASQPLLPSISAKPKQPNAPVQAVPVAPEPVLTVGVDEVRTALRDVFNTKGAAAATELLKEFNVTRLSEVNPEQYHAFAMACKKVLL